MSSRLRYPPPRFRALQAPIVILLLLTHLLGCGGDAPPDEAATPKPLAPPAAQGTLVAVGDSLTAGLGVDESEAYPALLQKKLADAGYHFEVVNAGISGETSSGALSRIEWVISSLNPDLIILETGANDGLRGIDPDVLRANLDRIVSIAKAAGIPVILCGMKMLPNLGPEYTREFSEVYPEIARKHDIPLIPFFLEGVAGNPRLNQPDRLHPTSEGYRRIVEHIYPYVLEAIKTFPPNPSP